MIQVPTLTADTSPTNKMPHPRTDATHHLHQPSSKQPSNPSRARLPLSPSKRTHTTPQQPKMPSTEPAIPRPRAHSSDAQHGNPARQPHTPEPAPSPLDTPASHTPSEPRYISHQVPRPAATASISSTRLEDTKQRGQQTTTPKQPPTTSTLHLPLLFLHVGVRGRLHPLAS